MQGHILLTAEVVKFELKLKRNFDIEGMQPTQFFW